MARRRKPARENRSGHPVPAHPAAFFHRWSAALLFLATLAVFAGVLRNGFVSYDDELYVLRNPHVSAGLSAASLVWAAAATEAANWHPLTWISHMTDVSLFGMSPAGHHATSLLIHAANGLLVFLLLRAATGKTGRSVAAAALFALHPLRVESVAWIAERKDVLSVFFGLLTIGAWGRWTVRRERRWYAASLLLFAASLMSKGTLVTLPLLLLILDFWPLGRLRVFRSPDSAIASSSDGAWRLLLEKIPYAALSAAAGALILRAQRLGGATEAFPLPLALRLENAVVSAVRYLGKEMWPTRLAVLYPHPAAGFGWRAWASALLIAAVTAAVLWQARRRPYLAAGWLWYLTALLPVIGIVQLGWQAMADRYTYVPSLGLAAAFVWGVAEAAAGRVPVRALAGAAAAALILLSAGTIRQISTWKDSLALYEHAIAVTGPNETMQIDLGNELARRGRTEEAGRHFAQALRIVPGSRDALYALGSLAQAEGRLEEARSRYEEAARRHPDFAEAHVQIAATLVRLGRPEEAVPEAQRALAIRPGQAEALYVWGSALDAQGRASDAEAKYAEALVLKPDYAEAHQNLGELLVHQGRTDEAIPHFEAALRANPDFAEARQALKTLLRKKN